LSRVTVSPDPFTLIEYDAHEIAAIVEDLAALLEVPSDIEIDVVVDEELFAPLVGHTSDAQDRRISIWISGGNFEDNRRPRHFSAEQARRDLLIALLRGTDRLGEGFAAAPPDGELSRGERAAWDVFAVGRAGRHGEKVRHQASLYEFRLQHGFTDVADAAFERLWNSPRMTWEAIREICKETGAADRGDSKIPVDLLRQK
jgi:hypothetical protein